MVVVAIMYVAVFVCDLGVGEGNFRAHVVVLSFVLPPRPRRTKKAQLKRFADSVILYMLSGQSCLTKTDPYLSICLV